jgi:hypothetical protein
VRAVTYLLDKAQTPHLYNRIYAWVVVRTNPDDFESKYEFARLYTRVSTFVQLNESTLRDGVGVMCPRRWRKFPLFCLRQTLFQPVRQSVYCDLEHAKFGLHTVSPPTVRPLSLHLRCTPIHSDVERPIRLRVV